ncbi:unnamed protein product [marine sediment metagenome]|uniref:Uncharacterized protein n=1 Tax=marine sediment metagenome TaxID=412755 RepID=X1CXR5_9ZZZZ
MKCLSCKKEVGDGVNGNGILCECGRYNPTPEQARRMDEAMIKVNKALSKVFK